MKLVKSPSAILRAIASPVTVPPLNPRPAENSDDEISKLIRGMRTVMARNRGLGLSAPQVGSSLRVIMVARRDYALVNPVIVHASDRVQISREGCLSLPGVSVDVPRHESVVVRYTKVTGGWHNTVRTCEEEFMGLMAEVAQHEIDHLNGILITDYVNGKLIKPAVPEVSATQGWAL